MENRQINCIVCGTEFTFTVEEQEFFQSKGFQEPRKCKPCRQAAKAQKQGFRPQKQLFDTVCSACGITTQVPFQPKGDRPVYCRDCYKDVGGGGHY